MHHRTSLPLLATLLTFLVTLSACSINLDSGGGTGAGGGGTGGTGGGGTGGGGTGGTGGGGGDPGGPACEPHESKVFACAYRDPPAEGTSAPRTFVFSGTVTAVRPPGAEEPCTGDSNFRYKLGRAAPEVMIDLADATGNALTLGLAAPGFASSAVAVGDTLDVDFSTDEEFEWGEKLIHLRLERDGELVAAVGENDPIGLTISQGERECYNDYDGCGTEELTMIVEAEGKPAVSIAHGESAEVGDLTVTNDLYIKKYDLSGACNFGLAVEYIVSAVPTP
ncbi:uncharacterized protein SOCE26_019470 [Sorangium cellulosum]|uniref:Secreted protein n=1 Tax=Sorangium cellulosum TaxID=56 RepID=A0A2L0EMM6_SORCE|nr:hypothetical protein [Sorangium cellulosum]AUX40546.1 uncharacterized protein SOCE26_019470 [Sorangium cellulosum]